MSGVSRVDSLVSGVRAMIVDSLLSWGFGLVGWFVALLPTVSPSCGDVSLISGYLGWIGGYVDLTACAAVLTSILTIEASVQAVQAVKWLYKLIPVVGGH
jgi:hypothetical protein